MCVCVGWGGRCVRREKEKKHGGALATAWRGDGPGLVRLRNAPVVIHA